ncbi:pitrilysin family protein, partial [uncultured Rikenella sp.]|uniref:M16 family metallopeptidase n=1 Tax=uncultured Rikenella sp. TaxID=368003 RepID=UPI0026088852
MGEAEFDLFTLPNGIRCIHRRPGSASGGVAHIALTIGAGTRDEAAEQHGVAHLVEHLLFKGTARRSAYRVNSLLENTGGELNAFTTKEETVIHATLLRSEFSKGVDLLSDMAFNSRFDPRELDKEREVIIDEINSYRDSPAELIFDEFEELLFAGAPLGRNILGTPRNLKRATREQVVRYVTGHYRPERVVFSASAQMSHRRFREVCERYLGGLDHTLGADGFPGG